MSLNDSFIHPDRSSYNDNGGKHGEIKKLKIQWVKVKFYFGEGGGLFTFGTLEIRPNKFSELQILRLFFMAF